MLSGTHFSNYTIHLPHSNRITTESQHPGFCTNPTYTGHCAIINIIKRSLKTAEFEISFPSFLPFLILEYTFQSILTCFKIFTWSEHYEIRTNAMYALLLQCLVAKNIYLYLLHSTHNSKSIKMRHTWPISLFKCNPSFHRKQTP